jgi:DNA-binding HxlR family transcriptional regulator
VKSYGQFCPVARSLDVLGDRWTLLIIRELAIRDSRYSDLRTALPGIASNLLADRLAHLREHDVVERYEAPAPVGATVYRLGPRGVAAMPILRALLHWGESLLDSGQGGDVVQSHWLVQFVHGAFDGVDTSGIAPFQACLDDRGEPVTIVVDEAGVTALIGRPAPEALTVTGSDEELLGLLRGKLSAAERRRLVTGAAADRRRLDTLIKRRTVAAACQPR